MQFEPAGGSSICKPRRNTPTMRKHIKGSHAGRYVALSKQGFFKDCVAVCFGHTLFTQASQSLNPAALIRSAAASAHSTNSEKFTCPFPSSRELLAAVVQTTHFACSSYYQYMTANLSWPVVQSCKMYEQKGNRQQLNREGACYSKHQIAKDRQRGETTINEVKQEAGRQD